MNTTATPPRKKRWLGRFIRRALGLIVLALLVWGVVAYCLSTNDCATRPAPVHPMEAILHCDYGGPEILQLAQIEKPTPAAGQVLVRVRAASVNPVDLTFHGQWPLRPILGMRKPKETRMGVDYAGVVEAVGAGVTQWKPGDEVFGGTTGSFAEYVCVPADRSITAKPAAVSFEQAGAVPVAAVTALQGLRDKGKLQAGQSVLINGASGGVGTFAVQIAKAFGAHVTAVCSTGNLELVRSLGADRVIDYTREDFTAGSERYDLLLDLVGNHSFADRRRILKPGGLCVMAGVGGAGPAGGQLFSRLGGELYGYVCSRFVAEKFVSYIAQITHADLQILADLMQAGKVTPVIERTYPLRDTAAAVRHLETGHARGKIVVSVDAPEP